MPTEKLSSATLFVRPASVTWKGTTIRLDEVTGIKPPSGAKRSWPEFYGNEPGGRYRGGPAERQLRWPRGMLDRLVALCDEVYMSPAYREWCESGHQPSDVPKAFASKGWNCYELAGRVRSDYDLGLRRNRYGFLVPSKIDIGGAIKPQQVENGVPYYLGRPNDRDNAHAVVGVQEAGHALSITGGRKPLSWVAMSEVVKWYPGGVYPYMPAR